MKLGFIGLGRMGEAMVEHLLEGGVDVVVFNRTVEKVEELVARNQESGIGNQGKLIGVHSVEELVENLEGQRIIWLMVPQGKPVDEMIDQLISAGVTKDDIIIDGGNNFYKESVRHAKELKEKGIHFLDAGTSGGIEGARHGACLMIGGEKEIFEIVQPYFEKMALPGAVGYFGPAGAGHFVKMVHNGVEYGMLQAIGEGFELMEQGPYTLDLHTVADNWTKGSVVRGWLMELLERALREDPELASIEGTVGGGTTGKWTTNTAREFHVDTPAIDASLFFRVSSQKEPTFAGKVIAALRNQFGGHAVKTINRS
jgi:6-phosphogluconate dehydrogenase